MWERHECLHTRILNIPNEFLFNFRLAFLIYHQKISLTSKWLALNRSSPAFIMASSVLHVPELDLFILTPEKPISLSIRIYFSDRLITFLFKKSFINTKNTMEEDQL
jgi:hypothetical protein